MEAPSQESPVKIRNGANAVTFSETESYAPEPYCQTESSVAGGTGSAGEVTERVDKNETSAKEV